MAQSFRTNGIEEAEADARALIGHALHLDRARLIAQSDRVLESREVTVISALVTRRLRREPVSRILGQKEFWSLPISVTPDVLVPRPETETVVEAALDFIMRSGLRLEKLRILDIGTGSGALLVALLNELPNAAGTGTDVSSAALDVARANAARCRVDSRCNFVVCNIANGVEGPFDLIVSNPPYIAHDEIMTLEASLPALYEQRSTAQVEAKRYERRQLETAQHADLEAQRRVEQAIDGLLVQLLAHVQELQAIDQRCRPRQQRLRDMSSDLRGEPPRDPWHSTRLPGQFVEWAHEALRELRRG